MTKLEKYRINMKVYFAHIMLILFWLNPIIGFGQNNFSFKYEQPFGYNPHTNQVLAENERYLIIGNGYTYSPEYGSVINLFSIDTCGYILNYLPFNHTDYFDYIYYQSSQIGKLDNSKYALFSSFYWTMWPSQDQTLFVQLNNSLDSVSSRIINAYIKSIRTSSDSQYYYISGGTGIHMDIDYYADYYLSKIDYEGNPIWEIIYGNDSILESAISLELTQDNGFSVFGSEYSISTSELVYNQLIFDSLGNFITSYPIDTSIHNIIGSIRNSNGNYILYGNYNISNNDSISNYQFFLAEITEQGSVLWFNYYGGDGNEQINKITQLPDNSYACAGLFDSHDLLFCISQSGDSLWSRTFENDGSIVCGFNDIMLSFDNLSIVFAGFYNDSIWLYKTDLLGNSLSDCSFSLNPSIHNNLDIIVFPNPFLSTLYIRLNNDYGISKLTIYNSVGIIIFEENLVDDLTSISLNSFNKGLYYYKIECAQNILKIGKLVKG